MAEAADESREAGMLVVTANWAIADGTLVGGSRPARIAREWLRDVRAAVIRGAFGRDGAYSPPAGLDVVLAGDTFDCLASAEWLDRERPWHGGPRALAVRQRVLAGCARRAAPLLAGLVRLAREGLSVPAADRRGRPSSAASIRVPVRVALLPGDRDRDVAIGAAAAARRGTTVAPAWSDGAVLVRHGHECDPSSHVNGPPDDDRPPTLGESVAVGLVAPFAVAARNAGVPPRALGPLLAALSAGGPAGIPAALAAWRFAEGAVSGLDGTVGREVSVSWSRAVEAWARAARREPPDCGIAASPLDALAAWYHAAGGPPPAALVELLTASPPRPAAAGTSIVLGHPAPARTGAGTVCLGRPPLRRWGPVAPIRGGTAALVACVAAVGPAAGADTVVCRRDDGRPDWRRLAAGGPDHGDEAARAAGIVDAA